MSAPHGAISYDTTVASSDLTERYAASVMNTFGPPQRVLSHGSGCYVWDTDGNRYLDLLAGIAVNALGHAHPAVVAAITSRPRRLGHVSNFFATEAQITLAERLLGLIGAGTAASSSPTRAPRPTRRRSS